MLSCSALAASVSPYSIRCTFARRRFLGALACSALVHLLVTASFGPGASRNESGGAEAQPLAVRLVAVEEPAPAAAALFDAPPPASLPLPTQPRTARKPAPALPAHRSPPSSPAHDGLIAEVPDPSYYGARQLDVYPVLAVPLDLRYAPRAAAAHIEGHALLLVLIDAAGHVDDVSVVEAWPAGYFEEAARSAFLGARFKPALKNGRAVKSRVLIQITYGGQ